MHFKYRVLALQSKENSKFGLTVCGQQRLLFINALLGPKEEKIEIGGIGVLLKTWIKLNFNAGHNSHVFEGKIMMPVWGAAGPPHEIYPIVGEQFWGGQFDG